MHMAAQTSCLWSGAPEDCGACLEKPSVTAQDLEPSAVWNQFRPYLVVLAAVLMQRGGTARVLVSKIDPEDIVQETLLKAWRSRARFSGSSNAEILAYLRAMLSHTLIDHARGFLSAKRDVRLELRLGLEQSSRNLEAWLTAAVGVTPGTRLGREEEFNLLCEAILRLRPVPRSILLARHVEGLTLNQIAERLGKKRETVAKAWSRAIRELHERLGPSRP